MAWGVPLFSWNKLNSNNLIKGSQPNTLILLRELCTKPSELGLIGQAREKESGRSRDRCCRCSQELPVGVRKKGVIKMWHALSAAMSFIAYMISINCDRTKWSGLRCYTEVQQLCLSSCHCQAESRDTEVGHLLLLSQSSPPCSLSVPSEHCISKCGATKKGVCSPGNWVASEWQRQWAHWAGSSDQGVHIEVKQLRPGGHHYW